MRRPPVCDVTPENEFVVRIRVANLKDWSITTEKDVTKIFQHWSKNFGKN